jgi:hypothetical protein
LNEHLELSGEDVEMVPWYVDASNDEVVEPCFHVDVSHPNVLRSGGRLDDVNEVDQFCIFIGDGLAVETCKLGLILVDYWK